MGLFIENTTLGEFKNMQLPDYKKAVLNLNPTFNTIINTNKESIIKT